MTTDRLLRMMAVGSFVCMIASGAGLATFLAFYSEVPARVAFGSFLVVIVLFVLGSAYSWKFSAAVLIDQQPGSWVFKVIKWTGIVCSMGILAYGFAGLGWLIWKVTVG